METQVSGFGTGPGSSSAAGGGGAAHAGRDVQARRPRACDSKDNVHVSGRREVCEGGDMVPKLWHGELKFAIEDSIIIIIIIISRR